MRVRADRYLEAARGAWRWIESLGRRTDAGMTWPCARRGRAAYDLYHGMPGGLLLAAALHEATGSANLPLDLTEPLRGLHAGVTAGGVVGRAGLYDGLAGLVALGIRLDRCGYSSDWSRLAEQALRAIATHAKRTTDGGPWDGITDILSGAAGAGMTMLDARARGIDPEYAVRLARRTGNWLAGCARPAENGGLQWLARLGQEIVYPNFGHGIAGVTCFLSELFAATDDRRYLTTALAGAAFLEQSRSSVARRTCWHHDDVSKPRVFYAGWCHGPAGTARAYYSLYRTTKDLRWLARVRECASWVMKHARPSALADGSGYWNLGRCCGVAGVGDFLVDLHLATGEAQYLHAARSLADHLVQVAEPESGGLKWPQAEFRKRPAVRRAQTGLMQGAAGIGLFLVKMHRVECGERGDPWALPDNPFHAVRN